jgi:hypothetical protein
MTDYTGSYNGLSFGPGTNVQLLQIDGFEDGASVTASDTQRPRDHGEFFSNDFAGGRIVTLKMLVLDSGAGDFFSTVDAVKAATVPQAVPLPLVITLPSGRSRQLLCRPRRRTFPVDPNYSFRYGLSTVEFHANDPRWYDTTLQSVTLLPPAAGGGLTFPVTFPLSFGGGSVGNSATVTNAGNFGTRPVVTITGPCSTPSLQNGSGATLSFNLTLAAGDQLVVDFGARTAVLNGTANEYPTVVQPVTWFELPAGSSTIRFSVASSSAGCQAAWTFRNAYV